MSDDSGVEVDALNNLPGVYTADWAEVDGGRDFNKAMEKVLYELNSIKASFPRTARFCCTLCLSWPDGSAKIFSVLVPGEFM